VGLDPGGQLRAGRTRLAQAGRACLLLALLAGLGCAHGGQADLAQLASNSDQVIWEAGQKALEKRQYESARQYFRRIVEGFPHSEHAPSARLAIGDSHFKEGGTANYLLAVSAYREFLTVYPSHPRSDYAQLQVGEAYFRQKNGADRDQTDTQHALEEFQRLLDQYPSSGHTEVARERIRECRQSLARAEYLAGYFYQRTRRAWRAAVTRYEGITQEYPDYERLDEVLFRLAQCLDYLGRSGDAVPHLARVVGEYPQSEYADDAQKLKAEIEQLLSSPAAAPSPAAIPSPAPAGDGETTQEPAQTPPSPVPSAEPSPEPSPDPSPEPSPGADGQ
jgi:outer membrane protein assembly factor BamD